MIEGLPPAHSDSPPCVVTIGSYDGVHRGHRALLRRLLSEATRRHAQSAVLTFDPHPRCIVDPAGCPPLLSTVPEREALLRAAGVDRVMTLRFSRELSRWGPEAFCDAIMSSLTVRAMVLGAGFALGRRRTGDVDFLRRYGTVHGFDVVAVPPLLRGGEPISSSRIRSGLLGGRIGEANAMLGRMYALGGEIVPGRRIGARLGFPTANLGTDPGRCLPQSGVYATWLDVAGSWRAAATSIGVRPTFGDEGVIAVEAHVLDFDGDLYGHRTRLAFVRRLRAERRFGSEAELSTAIAADVERVRMVLDRAGRPA